MESPESIVEQIWATLNCLSTNQRALYEDLHHVAPNDVLPCNIRLAISKREFESPKTMALLERLISIFYTNFFTIGYDEPTIGGLFMTVARINHSCIPNAYWTYNEDLNHMTVQATQDIEEGAEITISYIPTATKTREQRHHDLEAFSFTCRCKACENPEESDGHRARLNQLNELIRKYMDGEPTGDEYQSAMAMIEEYTDLFHEENLVDRELEDR